MSQKTLPCPESQIAAIADEYGTPFHLYSERDIRTTARSLKDAFHWVSGDGFRNFFAVKALPNPWVLSLLREEGMGFDCSSLPELELAAAAGAGPLDIVFSSNDTPPEEFVRASELGALINLDDISHIDMLVANPGMPEFISLRYNPGMIASANTIIGKPDEAKYGFTRDQLREGFRLCRRAGARRFGLHAMVVSNERDPANLAETARTLFEQAVEIYERDSIRIELVNLGGGIGIPYEPHQNPVDLEDLSRRIQAMYQEIIEPSGLDPMRIVMENGRVVTGPNGYLVSRVRHRKETYRTFIGLDASMADLMRPGMYGAYHHITVLGKADEPLREVCDVTGSLCENNDKFAVQRGLPPVTVGDLVVIHDTGAHGHAMGFNYNGKLRGQEILLQENGTVKRIRRAETVHDYFATLDFPGLP